MLTEVRSGLDVIIMFIYVRNIEIKTLGKELDDYTMVYQHTISYKGLV
ncbi:hypothetical protein SJAV_01510 [Sulfurisphaera javensis]|uniref:Uncharacterized protein n=1 Tax=Sulfurisphaera javensis TaxID=2049879 RepID=A0AAT9GMT8_9CREN